MKWMANMSMIPLTFELILFLVLILAGLVILVIVLRAFVRFLIPIVAAAAIWLYTRDLVITGVAFVLVALIQLAIRRR
jgi:hypothetical protein